jgi:hypothetical protein
VRACAARPSPRRLLLLLAVLGAGLGHAAEPEVEKPPARRPGGVEPPAHARKAAPLPPLPAEVEASIERGIEFLLRSQNKDGSWGSARRTKDLNIYAPVPGAHLAFRAADTALCISALCETGRGRPGVEESLDRAERWLEENLPRVRRATPDALYNCWAHAYGIEALAKMLHRHSGDEPRSRKIRRIMEGQVDFLSRYESVDGGWGYYDLDAGTQKPASLSTSFTTATVLVALEAARDAGVSVPEKLVRRGLATILRQRKPDFSYVYSERHKWRPMYYINRPGGSLGRSQACNFASRIWGDEKVTDGVLRTWLERLFDRNLWLDMGRKRPIPHESWFLVAGYFFYYGHYYAALCMELLSPDARRTYQDRLARILVDLQEKDGSWWDYPFYDYHQPYGTAFALMSLARCRSPATGAF